MSIQINHPINPAPENAQTWTTAEMMAEFDVLGFQSPLVFVKRKADGIEGTLEFNGMPRVYHTFST